MPETFTFEEGSAVRAANSDTSQREVSHQSFSFEEAATEQPRKLRFATNGKDQTSMEPDVGPPPSADADANPLEWIWEGAHAPAIEAKPSAADIEEARRGTKLDKQMMGIRLAADEYLSGMTSFAGVATLGLSRYPALARLAAGVYGLLMGKTAAVDVPEQLGAEMGKPEAERDPTTITKGITTEVLTAGMLAAMAHAPKSKAQKLADEFERYVKEAKLPEGEIKLSARGEKQEIKAAPPARPAFTFEEAVVKTEPDAPANEANRRNGGMVDRPVVEPAAIPLEEPQPAPVAPVITEETIPAQTISEPLTTEAERPAQSASPTKAEQRSEVPVKAKRARKPKAETPADALEKVQTHVKEVATGAKEATPEPAIQNTTGPRAAKEIKSELVQRIEEEIAKLGPAPQLLYSDPKKVGGKREFYVFSPDKTIQLKVREALGTSWTIESNFKNEKTGVVEWKKVDSSDGDIRTATRGAEATMQEILSEGGTDPITISIPGDGTFKIRRNHASLNGMLAAVKRLKTGKESNPIRTPSSYEDAATALKNDVADAKQVYGSTAEAYRRLSSQLARAEELAIEPEQAKRLRKLVDELKSRIEAPFNLARERVRRLEQEFERAAEGSPRRKEIEPQLNEAIREEAAARAQRERDLSLGAAEQRPTGSSGAASKASGRPEFPVLLGGLDAIRPMETPEMLRLVREMGGDPVVVRKLRNATRGYAKGAGVTLSDQIFADPQQVAMTLAHEIGHVNDYLPEGTLKRGNVVGRLIGSVNKFMANSFGNLNNKELRAELIALSEYWRPWDRTKSSKSFIKYRDSAKELYADALSVLLNSPGLLEQRAPKFYKAFFEHLDRKPRFKEEFFGLQDLLARGPEAVLGERLKQSRESFEKGEALLHEKIKFREAARNSFKDFLTKVRIQSLDIADFVRRKLGSKDPRQGSEFDRLYEEWKFDDNRNAADVARIYHEMIKPLQERGIDEHTFGQVLELQRIAGGVEAYKDMQALRKALGTGPQGAAGPTRFEILVAAEKRLAELERKGVDQEQAIEQVILPLESAGIPFELVERYRQLRSEQGTRAEIANPQGRSPIMADAELKQLVASLTPEQQAAMNDATAKFRQLIFDRVTEARDAGIINKITYDNVIVPNKDTYAAFRPLDKIDTFVSPMVRKARGAVSDIENPFITTLLKLQSLNNLIETQRLKNNVRDQMTKLFPGEFVPAETRWTGRRREAVPPKPDEGRVKILEDGRLVEYKTDPYVAKMFDKVTPTDSFWLNKVLEVPFRTGIYPLIIKYNPGFLLAFNPRRDMARTIRNLYAVEGVTRRELLPNYAHPEVLKAVNDYLQGRPNALAEAMIRNKAITPSWEGFAKIDQQDVMTDLLRRYKMAARPTENAAARTLMWLPNKINQAGSFLEALPKFAAYKTLIDRGTGSDRASYLVRNYVGTPNFKVKGQSSNVMGAYIPFINIFLQGWRADLRIATNPKTAGGWWMQWMLQHGWQATLVGLAVAGVFGDDIKKKFEGISEYDRTNYGVIPIGTRHGEGEFGQKTVYLRTPRDETSRLFSAMTYKLTRAAAEQAMGTASRNGVRALPTEMFAFGTGVTPGITPILSTASAWKEYAAGRNPIDPFRNKPVMSDRDFAAGGKPALGDMLKWTLNQSGVLSLVRWNPDADSQTELVVSGLPVVNRLLKISDQGYREQQMNSEKLDASAKARLRIDYGAAANNLTAQHAWLQSLGAKRTEEQNRKYAALHLWMVNFYERVDEAAWNLRGNPAEQRKLIERVGQEAESFRTRAGR